MHLSRIFLPTVPVVLALAVTVHAAPPVALMPEVGSWEAVLVLEERDSPAQPATTPAPADTATAAEEEEKVPPATIVKVTSRASRGLEERVAEYADGRTRTLYRAKQATIAQTSPDNPFFFLLDRDSSDADPVSDVGYFGLQGLQQSHFKAEEMKYEIPARRYEMPAIRDREGEGDAVAERTVWINKETGKPLALRLGRWEYVFKVNTADPGKPKLRPEARKIWDGQKAALAVAYGMSALDRTPFDE